MPMPSRRARARAARPCSPARSVFDWPMPRATRSCASLAAVSPSQASARIRAPGCRWRTMPSSARPCRLTIDTSCSDQPRRAAARLKAEGCGRQSVSAAGTELQQHRADAVVERIAARQHHDRPAAMLPDLRQGAGDRARPGEPAAVDQLARQIEMPLAADDQLGRRRPGAAPPATGRRCRPRRCR